jgi:hypothetical protein
MCKNLTVFVGHKINEIYTWKKESLDKTYYSNLVEHEI